MQIDVTHEFIRPVRMARNCNLQKFSSIMGTDPAIISRLENGLLPWTPLYKQRFIQACRDLEISDLEWQAINTIIQEKKRIGEGTNAN
jgi:transcriptional regulator with XRE-family HTH domain